MRQILLATMLLLPLYAQDRRLQERLDPLLEQIVRDQNITGLAAGIVDNGRLVYARGFGIMNVGDPGKPVTTETLFHMASVTKLFAATAVMQLWEQGKVDLDAPVTKYIPYFQMKDARYKTITVRQMLTHTSGIPNFHWDKPEYDDGALERYVRSLKREKLDAEPGSRFVYSNGAYDVLGELVAKVSGVTFEDYVDTHILKPLRMSSSTVLLKNADAAKLAAGHTLLLKRADPAKLAARRTKRKAGEVLVAYYPYNRAHSPCGDLHSSVADMARWAMANLNRGELDGERILKSSTYDLMWKPERNTGNSIGLTAERTAGTSVGLSWFLAEVSGERAVFHNGSDSGFQTRLILFPARKIAVLFMMNCDFASRDVIDTALTKLALGS